MAQYGRLEVAGRLVTFRRHSRAGPDGESEDPTGDGVTQGREGDGQTQNETKEEQARQKMLKFDFGNEKGKRPESAAVGDGGKKRSEQDKRKERRQKLLLLKEDKDRFDVMRQIQGETKRWKQ